MLSTNFLDRKLIQDRYSDLYHICGNELYSVLNYVDELLQAIECYNVLDRDVIQRLIESAICCLNYDYVILEDPKKKYDQYPVNRICECFSEGEMNTEAILTDEDQFYILIDDICYHLNILYNIFEKPVLQNKLEIKRKLKYLKDFF